MRWSGKRIILSLLYGRKMIKLSARPKTSRNKQTRAPSEFYQGVRLLLLPPPESATPDVIQDTAIVRPIFRGLRLGVSVFRFADLVCEKHAFPHEDNCPNIIRDLMSFLLRSVLSSFLLVFDVTVCKVTLREASHGCL